VLRDPASGRTLELRTTQPGLQLYSGNGLHGQIGKGGKRYARHGAVCLEAQGFPDAPNQPAFPPVVLRPGEVYRQRIVHRFSAR
jgi:aldose 1-epimerase